MKHLTTTEYIERVRTLGFSVDSTPAVNSPSGYEEIMISKDEHLIVTVCVNIPYRMDSNWNALTKHLSNKSVVREMLVEALLIITTRYANTPIKKRNQTHETSVSSNLNIDQLREYQMQIQEIIENETEVDY